MQLTRAADYAVRVMVHMATLAPGARVNRTELATSVDCPDQFLSKVLQSLTKSGLITSHRGNTGGFELPPPRRRTTVLEVVEAIEGPLHLNVCLKAPGECDQAAFCPAFPVWMEAQKAVVEVLRRASIEELAKQVRLSPVPEPIRLEECPIK